MKIIYTRLLTWAAGMALTPDLILIHPRARGDAGLIAHEQKHCEQQRRDGALRWWWRYLTDHDFRLAAEVEAYRISYQHRPGRLNSFAIQLATCYRLDVTAEEAMRLIVDISGSGRGKDPECKSQPRQLSS